MSGMLGEIGTIEWARRTNGILGRGERARFLAAATIKAAAVLPRAGRGARWLEGPRAGSLRS